MRNGLMGVALAGMLLCGCVELMAQSQARPQEPFKLGTFERQGRVFLGLVLRDAQVVDIAQANTAFEGRSPSAPKLTIPGDMKELIARYPPSMQFIGERVGNTYVDSISIRIPLRDRSSAPVSIRLTRPTVPPSNRPSCC